MLIYLHIAESRFCYTSLYVLYKSTAQILCEALAPLKLLRHEVLLCWWLPSCTHSMPGAPVILWAVLATLVLAPSLNNSAAMQQEFHFYFVSASVSRPKARVQNVLCAHSCLFWVDFLAVSLLLVCWSWLHFQTQIKIYSYTM